MNYTILDSVRTRHDNALRHRFAQDVLAGFTAQQKFLPSMYFYDARGSELFEQITEVAEYYPTDCEFEILDTHGAEIAAMLAGKPLDVVELGAGDGRKTRVLLSKLQAQGAELLYMPVDISETAVANLVGTMQSSHPGLKTAGLVGEYFDCISRLETRTDRSRLVLFLGSNIGNFDFLGAMRFLRAIWKHLSHDDFLLVGFDLKKDIDTLMAAYNDSQGVTREFNLNVLRRINNELGGEFDLDSFSHHGFYNPVKGAMDSYLISLREQEVYVGDLARSFHFDSFEGVHMEHSYKYLLKDIEIMAGDAGFEVLSHWQDSKGWFVDSLWRVKKAVR